jgi:septum formation protein
MRLVLASLSPRRADLLRAAGFNFEIFPVSLDERFNPGETPTEYVARLAEAKARAAVGAAADAVVLGADTTVVFRGQVMGKPADTADAARMLRQLSGHVHEVLTGICLLLAERSLVHVETTRVKVAPLTETEISWYVASGEPLDKAGAYAVQGSASRFIEGIEGSYTNVVGLPVASVYNLLRELGCDILSL